MDEKTKSLVTKILSEHKGPMPGHLFWEKVEAGEFDDIEHQKSEIQKARQSLITLGLIDNLTGLTTRGAVYQTNPTGHLLMEAILKTRNASQPTSVFVC